MRIAVINETSAANRNADILAAIEDRGHEIINAGMTDRSAQPELSYLHTGLMTAILYDVEAVNGGPHLLRHRPLRGGVFAKDIPTASKTTGSVMPVS